jgi:hypothetical protein
MGYTVLKVGDKVSIVVAREVYPAVVRLVFPFEAVAVFEDPYLTDLRARYRTGVALEPQHAGRQWCRGHEGPAVNALRAVVALGGGRATGW